MFRKGVKVILFLSSYIPLFVIIMIRNYEQQDLVIALGIVIATVLIILVIVFWKVRSVSGKYLKIEKIENLNRVGLEYFITYIIPFLAINFLEIKDLLALGVIFFVMGVIYIKSDLIYMNPILNLAGFNLYKVISDGHEHIIITRKKRNEFSNSQEVFPLAEDVYYS